MRPEGIEVVADMQWLVSRAVVRMAMKLSIVLRTATSRLPSDLEIRIAAEPLWR